MIGICVKRWRCRYRGSGIAPSIATSSAGGVLQRITDESEIDFEAGISCFGRHLRGGEHLRDGGRSCGLHGAIAPKRGGHVPHGGRGSDQGPPKEVIPYIIHTHIRY